MLVVLIVVAWCGLALADDGAAAFVQQGPFYFEQQVDHFGNVSGTFKQRYFTIPGNASLVFLYISGEAPLEGFSNDYVIKYAAEFGATLVTLEHRYYGESLPFGNMPSTPSVLALLTVEQALADLAAFAHSFAAGRPVVTFGCSYAGALSAWFRVQYPNVTIGSVSSSGVVNPILDFFQFDEQVTEALQNTAPACLQKLRDTYSQIDLQLQHSVDLTLDIFGASGFDVRDFLFYMADSAAETVQYGYQDTLCSFLNGTGVHLVDGYASFLREFYVPVYLGGDVSSYSRMSLEPDTHGAGRAWWWQKCSQLAYFQTAPPSNSLRSSNLTLDYFRDFCSDVFGESVWPDVNLTIARYGGAQPRGDNIFFLQSSQDPWQRAGVQATLNDKEQEFTVVCTNCGHCSDTRGCPSLPPIGMNSTQAGCHDMAAVNKARQMTESMLSEWIKSTIAAA